MRGSLSLLVLCCCTPAHVERVHSPQDLPEPVAPDEAPPEEEEPDPCAGRAPELHILIAAESLQDCVERCWVSVPFEVLNCGEQSERVHQVEVVRLNPAVLGGGTVYEFEQTHVPPAGSLGRSHDAHVPGEYQLTVIRDGDPVRAQFNVRSPALEAAMLACDACQGDWGPMGMSSRLGCNCRTQDVGQTCISGAECEGACIFERSVAVTDPPPGEPACTSWVMQGTCSARSRNFGCRSYLREPRYSCTRPLRAPHVCVD